MILKFAAVNKLAVLLAAVAVVAIGLNATQAHAQTQPDVQKRKIDKDGRPNYRQSGPNVSYQQGPHTRVFITKRSWLDAGVEVLPGDRKFTDYAFPPTGDPGHESWFYGPPIAYTGGYPLPRPLYIPGFNPDIP